MWGFLLGAVVGALTAMLVAPQRGEETREMVRAKMDLWQDQMLSRLEQGRTEMQSMRRELLARLDDMKSQLPQVAGDRTGQDQMKIVTERQGGTDSD